MNRKERKAAFKPICSKCGLEMDLIQNGKIAIFYTNNIPTAAYSGDEFQCPQCKCSIVTSLRGALAKANEIEELRVLKVRPHIRVNQTF